MFRCVVAVAAAFALGGATLSYAQEEAVATSSNVSGPVLVNHGVGYISLGSGVPLTVGDRVMASHGGSATIVYSDGCSLPVSPGAVVTIDKSPCKFTAADLPTHKAPPAPVPLAPVEQGLDPTLLIGGGLLVAGAVTGIVLATQHHHNNFCFACFVPVSH